MAILTRRQDIGHRDNAGFLRHLQLKKPKNYNQVYEFI
jgi:hypothetical protein